MDASQRMMVCPGRGPAGAVFIAMLVGGLASAAAAAAAAAAASGHRVNNDEFGFSVDFDRHHRICRSMTDTKVHGFYVRLDQAEADCDSVSSETGVSAIRVTAEYNSTFDRGLDPALNDACPNRQSTAIPGSSKRLADFGFPGRRSAQCILVNADASIRIYVVTQAGDWPGHPDSPEQSAPYVNYTAALYTSRARVGADLEVFKRVLASVRIRLRKRG